VCEDALEVVDPDPVLPVILMVDVPPVPVALPVPVVVDAAAESEFEPVVVCADPVSDDDDDEESVVVVAVAEVLVPARTIRESNSGSHLGQGHAVARVENNRKNIEYNRRFCDALIVVCDC
jgi:hypothetical protein